VYSDLFKYNCSRCDLSFIARDDYQKHYQDVHELYENKTYEQARIITAMKEQDDRARGRF